MSLSSVYTTRVCSELLYLSDSQDEPLSLVMFMVLMVVDLSGLLVIHLKPDHGILGVVCFFVHSLHLFNFTFLTSPSVFSCELGSWTQSLHLRRAREALGILFTQNMESTLCNSVSVGATPSFHSHVQHMFSCTVHCRIN